MSYSWGYKHSGENKVPDIDREKLSEREYILSTWSNLPPLEVREKIDSEIQILKFPQFRYDEKFTYENPNNSIDIWYDSMHMARRIRNYLAFVFGVRFPLNFRIFGRNTLVPNMFASDDLQFMMGFYLPGKTQENLEEDFVRLYKRSENLLSVVKKDSFEDKLINLVGYAIWSGDPLENFNNRWRIVEITSSKEFSKITPENIGDLGQISDSNLIPLIKKIPISFKIKFLMKKYNIEGFDEKQLSGCKKIRDNISHGNTDGSTYKMVMKNSDFVKRLSEIILKSTFPQFEMENIFTPR